MRVLVTGAGGFLGSHLVERLVQDPLVHVTCVDSFRHNGDTDRLAHALTQDQRAQVTVMTHDLRAPFSRRQVAQLDGMNVIFDVASLCSVDVSIADPGPFISNNVAITVNTLDLACAVDCDLYVHISTDEVYGTTWNVDSSTDHRPSSPYAASKAAQEDICHAYRQTYSLPISIVTVSNMFGERQSNLAFIPKIIYAGLNDRLITVHTYDGKPGSRQYSYVREIVDFVVEKINNTQLSKWPKRVPLIGRHIVDNEYLVLQVSDILDRAIKYRTCDGGTSRPGYDGHYPHLDPENETDAFNDWPTSCRPTRQSFDEQLASTVNWFVRQPTWLE